MIDIISNTLKLPVDLATSLSTEGTGAAKPPKK
jgi:hypothetical protein